MVIRKLHPDQITNYLESGDSVAAFLYAATALESVLFQKLLFEKKIKSTLIEKWTLGRYIQWCFSLELIDRKWQNVLEEFNKERNKLAHLRGYMDTIKQNSEKADTLRNLITQVQDFIEQFEIKYDFNMDLEREYGKHVSRNQL